MDPSAACTTSRLQNFPFPVSESETLPQLGDCLFPDFISSTSNIVDGHTNDAMVFLLCAPQNQNTRLQDGRLESQSSGCSKKTILPFSRAIGQYINCLRSFTQKPRDSPGTPPGGIQTKSGCFRLIGSPVLNACCTPPKLQLGSMAAHGLAGLS